MKTRLMWFFEKPDDNASGVVAVLDGAEQEQEPETTPEPTPEPAFTTAAFDPKALASELGSVITNAIGQQKKEQPPITPEEAKKLLRVWEPDELFLSEFEDLEKRPAAFAKLRDGLVRQIDTLVQMRLEELHSNINSRVEPALTFIQEQQVQQRKARFEKQYPALANPALLPVLDAVAAKLSEQQFSSENEMFEALAKGAEATIKQINPNFSLGGAQQKQKSSSGIAVTSPGGGGGGGGVSANQPTSTKSHVLSILGDV